MEQQKLPNVTTALVLSIIAFIGCCCTSGILGVILAGIAFYLLRKDERLYAENPDLYSNFSQLKTAKIVTIIALVLSAISIILFIIQLVTVGWEGILEQQQRLLEQYQ